jgi:hypothetical protein
MDPAFHLGIRIPLVASITPRAIPLKLTPRISEQDELDLGFIVFLLLTSGVNCRHFSE